VNVTKIIERSCLQHPEKVAITFEGKTWTYAELDRDASRLATALSMRGVKSGDRVAIFLPNVPEFVLTYVAALKIGAIAVSLNVMLKRREVSYILNDCEPATLVTQTELLSAIPPSNLSTLDILIAEGDANEHSKICDLIDATQKQTKAITREDKDPAAILYTSGTTGFPKGATLSHSNIRTNVEATVKYTGLKSDDRLLLFLPLFHCFGQNFILQSSFLAGATIILQRRFEPETTIRALRHEGVTMFFAVPTIFVGLLNAAVPKSVFSTVRFCFSAAASLPAEIAARWQETYGHTVWEGYGLTETSPLASYNHPVQHKLGSIGIPIHGVEMKIVRDDGSTAKSGEWGEIAIKGPNVMLGYWKRPEATAAAIKDGWFHSGDIGICAEDGTFEIRDRKKDTIISSGFNVYPAEIENELYKHPAIAEVAVYGKRHYKKGEIVCAAVIPSEESSQPIDAATLDTWCRDRMAAYKVPREFSFIDEIPKSATGKVLKRVLRGDADGPPG